MNLRILYVVLLSCSIMACRTRHREVKKPVIYLYPETEQAVSVRLNYFGEELIATYPVYNSGWEVVASPDGSLLNKSDNQTYQYLFYEGNYEKKISFDCGFSVPKELTIPFLQESLKKIGLIPREYNDMISFWLPELNKHEWNFIHFSINREYSAYSTLEVVPKPDSEIRVMMEFSGMNNKLDIPSQNLPSLERNGFTLVEWGGVEVGKESIRQFSF